MALTECRECGARVSRKAKQCPDCGIAKPGRRWWNVEIGGCGGCLVLGLLLFILFGILGDTGSDLTDSATSSSASPPSHQCESVPASMVSVLANALTVQGGGSIRNAAAVRSGSFERLYFIAAEIDGPGLEGRGDIGVWASNRLEGGAGMVFSVNAMAEGFSEFGSGRTTDANVTMSDDGARAAESCVEP